jgi:hypothetical protein
MDKLRDFSQILQRIKKILIKSESGSKFRLNLLQEHYYTLIDLARLSIPNDCFNDRHYKWNDFMRYLQNTKQMDVLNDPSSNFKMNHELCLGFLFFTLSRELIYSKVTKVSQDMNKDGEETIEVDVIHNIYLEGIEVRLGFQYITEELEKDVNYLYNTR